MALWQHLYKFTNDDYINQVLNYWLEWYNEKNHIDFAPSDEQLDEMFLELGFDELAEIIFTEFPLCADTPNCDFDAEYCWNEFLRTEKGKKAAEWLEEHHTIDSEYFLDELDKSVIAETVVDTENIIDTFCKNNPYGKQMSEADRKVLIDAIENGEIGEFENGKAFGADEYAYIEMTNYDGEHNYEDLRREENKYLDYAAKKGKLIGSWITDYNDIEVYVLYSVDLEDIAKLSLK
jgi:hypothetical protein